MSDREVIDMTKKLPSGHNIGGKLPSGHNIGGGAKQKRRKEFKQESDKNEVE
jgi:hypothetical protein